MSLANIQLQPVVLEQLYKNTLVELKEKAPVIPASPASKVGMLGKNRKEIVIIIDNHDNAYLPENDLNFLIGILNACQLSMEDTGIINIRRNEDFSYQQFGKQIAAEKVILFDVAPASLQLPLAFPFYQLQKFQGVTYLSAPALAQLMQDKGEKLKLWNSLKQLFNI